jgi:hypothetical protein
MSVSARGHRYLRNNLALQCSSLIAIYGHLPVQRYYPQAPALPFVRLKRGVQCVFRADPQWSGDFLD